MASLIFHISLLAIGGFFFSRCNANFHVCIKGSNHQYYNKAVQICCNGELKPRVREQECCGNKTYFTGVSICCQGEIEDRFVPPKGSRQRSCSSNDEQCREQMCCGKQPVDKEDTICCNQTPVYLNDSQQRNKDFLQCCGENIINRLSHFCCGVATYPVNSTLGCCERQAFDKEAEKCLTAYMPHKVVSKYKNLCGNQEYDSRYASCCSGTLQSMPEMDPANPVEKNPRHSCCDNIAYDNTKDKCCRERHTGFPTHTIGNEPNIYCCGIGFYNETRQDCFKGRKLDKVPGKVRCGYGYIDENIEGCCHNQIYNTKSHKCCMGQTSSVISKDNLCCNGEGANDTVLCCADITTRAKRRAGDNECCYNYKTKQAQTYNSWENEHCVNGEIMELPKGGEPCGRSDFYFPKTQICCGEKAYNVSSRLDACCGDKPYNSSTGQCCNYQLSNISPKDGSCCTKDFKVYRFDDRNNPCRRSCGNVTFDDSHQICCQDVVHAIDGDDTECCGSSTISSYYQGCCGGHFSWLRNGNTRCCGDMDLYNKKHAKCIKNKVVPRVAALRKLSDTQKLCSRSAIKYFDGGIKYACESQYIIRARLINVRISENVLPNVTHINLSFAEITNLDRGDSFNSWNSSNKLVFSIEVSTHDDIKCRKNYLTKYCKIIVFFNGNIKGGIVKISKNSKFFLTNYSRKRESLITKKLSYDFCKTNFNVH